MNENGKASKQRGPYSGGQTKATKGKGRQKSDYNKAIRGGSDCGGGATHYSEPAVKSNDWSFYAASDQIARDVASIPFNYLNGTKFDIAIKTGNADSSIAEKKSDSGIPAIMSIEYLSSIGAASGKPTDGINLAAAQLYTKIRRNNSGAKNYEAPDVMMYILAMRDIYANYFQAKKIIGMAQLYNLYNHNLPNGLLSSNGVDDNADLRANLATYRARLNIMAKQINSFAVPSYFKMFDRSVFINSYVFTDSESLRSQFYNFYKKLNYKWSGTTSTTGTELKLMDGENEKNVGKLSVFLDNIQTQLNAIQLDEDALTMSGDIAKAFTDLYSVNETDENYIVPVKLDYDVLGQIENMLLPTLSLQNNMPNVTIEANVTQSGQLISFSPTIQNATVNYFNADIWEPMTVALNSHKDNPDYKDVLEWTRLMSTWKLEMTGSTNATAKYVYTSSGLEIPYNATMWIPTHNGTSAVYTLIPFQQYFKGNGGSATSSISELKMKQLTIPQHFDWHPFLYIADDALFCVGDSKVITHITKENLENINHAAVLGAVFSTKTN